MNTQKVFVGRLISSLYARGIILEGNIKEWQQRLLFGETGFLRDKQVKETYSLFHVISIFEFYACVFRYLKQSSLIIYK